VHVDLVDAAEPFAPTREPIYRVQFWSIRSGWADQLESWRVVAAVDASEVIEWAEANSAGRQIEVLVESLDESAASQISYRLLRLYGGSPVLSTDVGTVDLVATDHPTDSKSDADA